LVRLPGCWGLRPSASTWHREAARRAVDACSAGAAAAARHYLGADHHRADDYYLAEGTGVVERYVATPRSSLQQVGSLEAVVVRHYTSRTGDPHRHLHLQVNARVFAAGQWRGLHKVGVRDTVDALNGMGHAAVMTDPAFREAPAHGGSPSTGPRAR
jgi:exodeoxyribonuclease V alpha subunit